MVKKIKQNGIISIPIKWTDVRFIIGQGKQGKKVSGLYLPLIIGLISKPQSMPISEINLKPVLSALFRSMYPIWV